MVQFSSCLSDGGWPPGLPQNCFESLLCTQRTVVGTAGFSYCVRLQWFAKRNVCVCNGLQSATCMFAMVCKAQHERTCSDTFGLNRIN